MNETLSALVGPGSQPAEDDGAELDLFPMPSGMMTFAAPEIPEKEDAADLGEGIARLEALLKLMDGGKGQGRLSLLGLDADNLALIGQVLGEGEVSVVGGERYQAQESVMAGLWRVRESDARGRIVADYVEVAAFPSEILALAFAGARDTVSMPEIAPAGVFNAPPLIAEINEHQDAGQGGRDPHVINLSLLPHTEADLVFLDDALGRGDVVILSRGYGNCRVTATGTKNAWWVQYYNSQDALILNAIEISTVPDIACAAPEDIADSADRLNEILEIYR